jgi:hypothetical protein
MVQKEAAHNNRADVALMMFAQEVIFNLSCVQSSVVCFVHQVFVKC